MMYENPDAVELSPWLVVLGEDANATLALWQLGDVASREVSAPAHSNPAHSHPAHSAPAHSHPDHSIPAHSDRRLSVAIFSDQPKASDYAVKCCPSPARVIQVDQTRFLSLMVDCFRQGIRYATLNPGDQTAQCVFVLRDVLRAAKEQLSKGTA